MSRAEEREFDKKLENLVGTIVTVIGLFFFAAWMLDGHENAKYTEKNITRTVTLAPGDGFIGLARNITYTGINNETATFIVRYSTDFREPRNITYRRNKMFTVDVRKNDENKLVPVKLRFIKRDDDTVTFTQTTREDVDKKTGKLRYPLEGVDTK